MPLFFIAGWWTCRSSVSLFGSVTSAPVVANCVKNSVIAFSPIFLADKTFRTILSEAIVPSQTLTRGYSFFHMSSTHNFSSATTLFRWFSSFFILIMLSSAFWLSYPRCILRSKCCFKAARKWLIRIHLSLASLFSVTPDNLLPLLMISLRSFQSFS